MLALLSLQVNQARVLKSEHWLKTSQKKLAAVANTMAAGRLIFFFDTPHETFSIWANEDIVR